MDVKELKKKLITEKINTRYYSINKLLPDRLILICENYKWFIFYLNKFFCKNHKWLTFYLDERGNKSEEKIFDSESEACNYFYNWIHEGIEFNKKYNLNY